MNSKPPFFERIRERASQRWDQLESDPELAGPWHQLFKQVQSPRHVLSELLQNADDVGATEAYVGIKDMTFVFEHNGTDFTEEEFASLCRFGYSNKRSLHTIGFRGIGFKSTFSLGDNVELYTATLSVSFNRERFTEPKWLNEDPGSRGVTQIRVAMKDEHRQREVEKNLQEWLTSPLSLLFFRNIRRLRVGDQEVHWGSLGPGPVPDTEWIALHDNPDQAYLIARSGDEPFPDDALNEIMQERSVTGEQSSDFPPCKIEIVLGAKGRLYVVLPTGVETKLPFACNAPFIQDPARLQIREASPTNRWLLERIGVLAASVMLQWLEQTTSSVIDKSQAYELFPDVDRDDNTLEGICAATVSEAFSNKVKGKDFLLTDMGELQAVGKSIIIPDVLFDVWSGEQLPLFFDKSNRPPLSRYISASNKQKLTHWKAVERVTRDNIISILEIRHLPRPMSWDSLLRLWTYIAPGMAGYGFGSERKKQLCIVPVQGKDVLHSASDVVRLGEKKLLRSDADWDFLASHLLVLNQDWPRFLAEQRRDAEQHKNGKLQSDVNAAYEILKAIGLDEASNVDRAMEGVATKFFKEQPVDVPDSIRLAQIAAKLNASIGDSFRFVTRDMALHPAKHILLFDGDASLEYLFPEHWCLEHLLHEDYARSYHSCTRDEWRTWVSSGRSQLCSFAKPVRKHSWHFDKSEFEAKLRRHGLTGWVYYPYKYDSYSIEDWDFEGEIWNHWITVAVKDANLWGRIGELILSQPQRHWSESISAKATQTARNGWKQTIANDLLPTWILKLRELPCLPDTRGFYRKPGDLLRRTPETESLLDIEAFIHGRFDTEANRPLLKLLGVCETPSGPDRLLDRLRALAKTDKPPTHEIDKWYSRLDQMVEACSTSVFADIKKAFHEEDIILAEGSVWTRASDVFLSANEEDVPGAAVIRSSVADLSIWRKIGIAERPTARIAIEWLINLPSGCVLSPETAKRVKALLPRHAERIWNECNHWLNLAGEWVRTETLEFALTMQGLTAWGHLHEWVKQKTADFQSLPVQITERPPFCDLKPLASQIEDKFRVKPLIACVPERQPWLNQLGIELCRIELDDHAEASRIKKLAARLAETEWHTASGLETIPYVGGIPAGTPKRTEVVWLDKTLYVESLPKAKLARLVPEKLGKVFGRPDIVAAFNYCFDRTTEQVTEYLEENFELEPRAPIMPSDITNPPAEPEGLIEKSGQPLGVPPGTPTIPPSVTEPEPTGEPPMVDHGEPPDYGTRKPRPTSEPRTSLIERFALSLGFNKEMEDRFYHADGSWITRTHGEHTFPWVRRTSTGELVCYYWPKDHCLEQSPLQVEADIWGLVDNQPETHAFILSDRQGDPKEIAGEQLRSMRRDGKITLYPAAYRLVYTSKT